MLNHLKIDFLSLEIWVTQFHHTKGFIFARSLCPSSRYRCLHRMLARFSSDISGMLTRIERPEYFCNDSSQHSLYPNQVSSRPLHHRVAWFFDAAGIIDIALETFLRSLSQSKCAMLVRYKYASLTHNQTDCEVGYWCVLVLYLHCKDVWR